MKEAVQKIRKDIWAYIICILAVACIWSLVFDSLTSIKTKEKVSVFIGSYSAGFDEVDKLNDGNRPEYLKIVKVNAYQVGSYMFPTFLNILGYETGDILILPESLVVEERCAGSFAEISEVYQAQFENLGFYQLQNKVYGIKIHDKENHESLIDGIDYGEGEKEEDFYMFFNKKSMHLSDLSDESKESEMDGAIQVAWRLLS